MRSLCDPVYAGHLKRARACLPSAQRPVGRSVHFEETSPVHTSARAEQVLQDRDQPEPVEAYSGEEGLYPPNHAPAVATNSLQAMTVQDLSNLIAQQVKAVLGQQQPPVSTVLDQQQLAQPVQAEPVVVPTSMAQDVPGGTTVPDQEWGHVSVPVALSEGQSQFDWDTDGLKSVLQSSARVDSKIDGLKELHRGLAVALGFEQPPQAQAPKVDLPLVGAGILPQAPSPVFPMPDSLREAWEDARRFRPRKHPNLCPPVVARSYKIRPEDWAYLGAVRRPDKILVKYNNCTEIKKGVYTLNHRDKGYGVRDALASDMVQITAHATRPVIVGSHAGNLIMQAVDNLASSLQAPSQDQLVQLGVIKQMAPVICTAFYDTKDALGRMNAYNHRILKESWINSSESLYPVVKRKALAANLVGGVPPKEEGVEFSAPLVGPSLDKDFEESFQTVTKMETLDVKTASFKMPPWKDQAKRQPPKQKSAAQQQKRSRMEHVSPVVAPTSQGRAQDFADSSAQRKPGASYNEKQQPTKSRGGKREYRSCTPLTLILI